MAKIFIPFKPITVSQLIERLQALNIPNAPVAIHHNVVQAQDLLQKIAVYNSDSNDGLPHDKGDDIVTIHEQLKGVDIVFLLGLGITGKYKEE